MSQSLSNKKTLEIKNILDFKKKIKNNFKLDEAENNKKTKKKLVFETNLLENIIFTEPLKEKKCNFKYNIFFYKNFF